MPDAFNSKTFIKALHWCENKIKCFNSPRQYFLSIPILVNIIIQCVGKSWLMPPWSYNYHWFPGLVFLSQQRFSHWLPLDTVLIIFQDVHPNLPSTSSERPKYYILHFSYSFLRESRGASSRLILHFIPGNKYRPWVFSVAASTTWNSLPNKWSRQNTELTIHCHLRHLCHLKTSLFDLAYPI